MRLPLAIAAAAALLLAAAPAPVHGAFLKVQTFLAEVAAVGGKDSCVTLQEGRLGSGANSYVFASSKTGFEFNDCQTPSPGCRAGCEQVDRCTSQRSGCSKARRCTAEDSAGKCVTIVPCSAPAVAPVLAFTQIIAFAHKTIDVFGSGNTAPAKQAEFTSSLTSNIAQLLEISTCRLSVALQANTNIVVAIAQFETQAQRDSIQQLSRSRRVQACIGDICYLGVQQGPQCRADIPVNTDAGKAFGTAVWDPLKAKDNSGEVVPLIGTHAPGSSFPIGETLVTHVAVDSSKNGISCSFRVKVTDKEVPFAACPANLLVNTTTASNTAVPTWIPPTFSDNSGLPTSTVSTHTPGVSVFPIGTTTVTYTGTDFFGNVFSCSFNVTVQDKEAPLLTCPESVVTINDPDKTFGTVAWDAPATSDNASPVTLTSTHTSPFPFPIDMTTVVTYTAKDIYNNQATCTFEVTINRLFVEVTGQVLAARTAKAIPNVSVSVDSVRVPPPPPLATRPPTTTTTTRRTTTTTRRTTTTTRRTTTTTRRTSTRRWRREADDDFQDYPQRLSPIVTAAPGLQLLDADGQPMDRRRRSEMQALESAIVRREAQIVANSEGIFTVTLEAKTGTFTFQVSVNGTICRSDIALDAKAEWTKYKEQQQNQNQPSRRRRATTTSGIVVPVPEILFDDEWQVILVWKRDALATHDDYNSYMVAPYTGCTTVNSVAPSICDDAILGRTTEFFPANYKNSVNGAGPETISFYGTQTGIYKHFVYGAAPLSSFIDSQAQVNLYNINGLVATWHVTLDGATAGATNVKHRFWHTFTLNLATLQLTVVNKITCSPTLSTGTATVVPGEGTNARTC